MLNNNSKITKPIKCQPAIFILLLLFMTACGETALDSDNLINSAGHKDPGNTMPLSIDLAEWDAKDLELQAAGQAPEGSTVTIKSGASGEILGTTQTNRKRSSHEDERKDDSDGHKHGEDGDKDGKDGDEGQKEDDKNPGLARWSITIKNLAVVPCRIIATTGELSAEKNVKNAPDDCDQGTLPPPENQPPNGTILTPEQNETITVGNSVTFSAQAEDPDGDTQLTYAWDFGSGASNSTELDPGPVVFATAGQYTVTFTVTDSQGASDPTPDTRIITVSETTPPPGNLPPNGIITQPAENVAIDAGGSVTFAAEATDPDGDTQLTYLWDFGGGADNATQLNPGSVTFATAGQYLVTFTVTDSQGASDPTPDNRVITVNDPTSPPTNQPPNGTITQPTESVTIDAGGSVTFAAEASDSDGDTELNYLWDFGGGADNSTQLNPGTVTFATAGQYMVSFTVTDSQGASDPTPDSRQITVNDPTLPDTSHAGRFDTYEGSATCVGCHETQVHEVHASVHYQWNGPTPYVVNLSSGGKMHSINDFCGYPDINFIGQLTNLNGETVDGGCATCHTGMGAKPDPAVSQAQLENIDCLTCHSDIYRRKVVQQADGSFRFAVAPEKMTVPVLEAITDIQRTPSRGSCVNCHSYAGGGCNNKRGDLEEEHRNPSSAAFDVHMAPTSAGGAGLVCVDCHTTQNHRIAGRGVDLMPTDLDQPVRCTNCHSTQPHNDGDINKHTAKVDCTVCHINEYAKIVSTDMVRDYSKPAILDTERQLYDPNIERGANLAPAIRFWNGTSTFYEFGTQSVAGSSGRVLIAGPVGDINDSSAKLFAFKHHLAVLPHDPVTGRILPVKMGIILQSGNIDAAITTGTAEVGWSLAQGYDFIDTERFMGLFHEVSPATEALGCNDCHNGGTRVDFSGLGYNPLPQRDPDIAANCADGCHGDESGAWSPSTFFVGVHDRHVDREGYNCSRCHNFSR